MGKFYVEVPVVMKLMVGVEAESKEDAVEKVFQAPIIMDVREDVEENENKEETLDYLEYEWEMYEKVVEGNVYYGGINKVRVTEEEDDED